MKPEQIVIGLGEIGTAIRNILGCSGYDSNKQHYPQGVRYDVLHICFPYSDRFVEYVKFYEEAMKPSLVIVHSTVPVGTCDPNGWVHSPVRGVHPELEQGIRTFVKFFGGKDARIAAGLFQAVGINIDVRICELAKNTEALKLWDTTIYGMNILVEKAIHAYCERHGLDFETVYTEANRTYNEGYTQLGHPEFSKYVLKDYPGPIGGHCVRENWELLDDPIAEISKDLHKRITDS